MSDSRASALLSCFLGLVLGLVACDPTLEAGWNTSHTSLPVDERNPVILSNDGWTDNWSGEYAMLLANSGGPPLAGLIVGASRYWPDLNVNVMGWNNLVSAARSSGFKNIPDVTISAGGPLNAPPDGRISSTKPNGSPGAKLIVSLSKELSLPWRPVVVLAGTALTDLADAYLLDPSVTERIVVVSSLGQYVDGEGQMTGPNGDLDPWADWIVAQKFRYVQVSVFYDQGADVKKTDLMSLPANDFGDWMRAKQPNISELNTAADQMAVLSSSLPGFVARVRRCAPDLSAGFNSPKGQGPPLVPNPQGNAWLVTEVHAPLAPARLWQTLIEPKTRTGSSSP